jgi:phosphoserine phosphatase
VASKIALVVDLDGTLINTDMLNESFLRLLLTKPNLALRAISLLPRGIAPFKEFIAAHISFEPSLLPYDASILEYINKARAEGRIVALASASASDVVRKISEHLDIFDLTFASSAAENLKSQRKRQKLDEHFGPGNYEYLGNSKADFAIWETSAIRSATARSKAASTAIRRKYPEAKFIGEPKNIFAGLVLSLIHI